MVSFDRVLFFGQFIQLRTSYFIGGYSSGSQIHGDVGIGTTSPNEKLTVDGGVNLCEVSVILGTTSSNGKIYAKQSDSNLYFKDDSGTESKLNDSSGVLEEFLDYSSSTSASTSYTFGIKMAIGTVSVPADSYVNITNLPFTSATTYHCNAQKKGNVNYSNFTVGEAEEVSGSVCRIQNQKGATNTIKWIAVGR